MVGHILKEIANITRQMPDKEQSDRIDALWQQAERLLTAARKEIDSAIPYLRQRKKQPDPAYTAITKARDILQELDERT